MNDRPPVPPAAAAVLCLVLLGVAACDVPTRPPAWDTRWIGPIGSLVVPADSFLPDGVTVSPEGDVFEVVLDGVRLSRTLGELCPDCRTLDGTFAPKPAFSSAFSSPLSLPGGVRAVTLDEARVEPRATHTFRFDPLRPGGTATGSLAVRVLASGEPVAGDTVTGAETAFPPDSTLELELVLADARLGHAPAAGVAIISPAGDPTRIDVQDSLTVAVPATLLHAREVDVATDRLRVVTDPVEVELQGIDATVRDAIRAGALLLATQNPFMLRGRLELRLATGGSEIIKTAALEPGATRQRVEFTAAEVRALLGGGTAWLTAEVVASAPDGTVTLRPSQQLVFDARFEIVTGVRP